MAKEDFDVIIEAEEELRMWKKTLLQHQVKYGDGYTISAIIEKIEKLELILRS